MDLNDAIVVLRALRWKMRDQRVERDALTTVIEAARKWSITETMSKFPPVDETYHQWHKDAGMWSAASCAVCRVLTDNPSNGSPSV